MRKFIVNRAMSVGERQFFSGEVAQETDLPAAEIPGLLASGALQLVEPIEDRPATSIVLIAFPAEE